MKNKLSKIKNIQDEMTVIEMDVKIANYDLNKALQNYAFHEMIYRKNKEILENLKNDTIIASMKEYKEAKAIASTSIKKMNYLNKKISFFRNLIHSKKEKYREMLKEYNNLHKQIKNEKVILPLNSTKKNKRTFNGRR